MKKEVTTGVPYSQYMPERSPGEDLIFSMANRIYLKKNAKLQEDFLLIAKKTYDTDVLEADFGRNSKQLVKEINKWVELETKNNIKNFLQQIDGNTVMMLINLVYFKAKWMNEFSLHKNKLNDFTNLNGQKKRVEMMCESDNYPFGQFERYQILQLDYRNNSSMYVVLPNEDVNLDDLLHDLDTRKLNDHLSELKPEKIDLQLPKFKLESKIDLNGILWQLGVKTLFSEQADLSRMSNEAGLRVSEAIQKAFISVDENGTEAGAATSFMAFCMRSKGLDFFVNRPFLFVIRLGGMNIFMGALKQL